MAIIYKWTLGPMDMRNMDGLQDVVEVIHWRCEADDGLGHVEESCSTLMLGPPDPATFERVKTHDDPGAQSQRQLWMGDAFIEETEALLAARITRLVADEQANAHSIK